MKLYIDPGTGSMLFSLAVGLLSVIWFGARKLYMKVKYLTPGRTKKADTVIPLVIFSDDKRYWQVFEPVVKELESRSFDVTYLTASPDDPALSASYPHMRAEFIGEGNKAFAKLNFLNATMVLSTTPGLDVYQWKRSKDVKYYVHIPHGPNDSTAGYRMLVTDSDNYSVEYNNGKQFDTTGANWWAVKDNIYDLDNWKKIDRKEVENR